MLVHICCSVDSHYFLRRIKSDMPNEKLVGYFYDPNIHPYSEYLLRYEDVKRSCDKLGVELIMGEYDYEQWLKGTKGLENEPEKGKRCSYCFDFRVGNSAKKALELGETLITTTLLMSPKKDFTQLTNALKNAISGTNLQIYAVDYRKDGGTNEQFELAKKDKLYHQNYCGCIFGLSKQRQQQKLPESELMSDINGRILWGSIEERMQLYKKVRECEANGVKFNLQRIYFLNYRLLIGLVKFNKSTIKTHFLTYSNFKRYGIKFNILNKCNQTDTLRDGVIFISICKYNELANTTFKTIDEICKASINYEKELLVRAKLCGLMSLNPIIVLDKIEPGRYEIYAKSLLYNDSKEILQQDIKFN